MARINLFWGGKPTIALKTLRLCAEPDGYREPWRGYSNNTYNHTDVRIRATLGHLCQAGLAEERSSGSRGGKFFHTTEAGAALVVASKFPKTFPTIARLILK